MIDWTLTVLDLIRLDWSVVTLMFLIVSGLFFLGVWEDAQSS